MISTRVPVFAGPRCIEFADPARAQQLLKAKNAKPVRRRKDKALVQINLANWGDDTTWEPDHPRGNPRRYSHDHEQQDNVRGCWKLRHLRTEDGPIYRLSVTDCLAK